MADEIEITPLQKPISTTIEVPGSKSITNRALLLAAITSGRSRIHNVLLSDDTWRMAAALTALGFTLQIEETEHRIEVEGLGGTIPADHADLFVGGAGTAMRFLAGFVTLGRGRFRLDGNQRMRMRPAGALLETLRGLGADAFSETDNGCPPIIVDTSKAPFAGGAATLDASLSSQFVSALLMPAPLWHEGLRLHVIGETARPFIAMTLKLMDQFGAHSQSERDTIVVPGQQHYSSRDFAVEPDASSASYFAAAVALVGGTITLPGITAESVQGDTGFIRILEQMGAGVNWKADGVEVSGGRPLKGIDIAMNAMPDMVPTLAALAPLCSSPTRITKVGFIRHHESDRLAALAAELRRLGVTVREFDDGLEIFPSPVKAASIETYDDPRIAMAFAVIGLKIPGVRIKNPACVGKTYPGFFDDLRKLYTG
ncbi:MAG: 3-phosphoshikimate 1-carboxyvinyltransferase [Candidatus Binataceae bacterium]